MKSYNDYMSNISVDAELHEKIMSNAMQKPAPLYRKRAVYRYAGLAACAAVLALCVWTVPSLLNSPTENLLSNPAAISSNNPYSQDGEQNAIVTEIPSDSDTIFPGLRDE